MKKSNIPYTHLCTEAQHEGVPAIEVHNLTVDYPHKINVLKNKRELLVTFFLLD